MTVRLQGRGAPDGEFGSKHTLERFHRHPLPDPAVGGSDVGAAFKDETQYIVFHTSTERLGFAPFSLQPGGTYRCTFELTLNIAHGTFHLVTQVYRYDIQKAYDKREPATTIFIGSTTAVGGAVNCFPRLIESETVVPATQSCEV